MESHTCALRGEEQKASARGIRRITRAKPYSHRGYDILDVAKTCEFEEIADLLVHDTPPASTELAACKTHIS